MGGFRLAQQGGNFIQLGFQLIQKLLLAGFLGLVLLNQLSEQFLGILEGQFPGLRSLKLRTEGVLHRADGAGNVLPDAGPGCFTGLLQGGRPLLYPVLKRHIEPGFENLPENLLPAFGVCQQQLEKIPLGYHGDLGKLAAVQPDDSVDLPGNLPALGDQPAVRQAKLGIRFLHHASRAPLGRALVLGISADGIGFAAVREDQFHKGGCVRLGVFGAEHGRVPVAAAGLPIEGVCNGVEQGGFTGSRVAGDQVKPLPAQLLQVYRHLTGVWPKGGQDQLQRSHVISSSKMESIRPCEKRRCSWLMA